MRDMPLRRNWRELTFAATRTGLGDLNEGPMCAVVAAWGSSGRSGLVASELWGRS
jgi:hypothetical protein